MKIKCEFINVNRTMNYVSFKNFFKSFFSFYIKIRFWPKTETVIDNRKNYAECT